MREMSLVVSAGGGATVASEMEGRERLFDNNACLVLTLVLDDTMVPATDGVEEVPPVPQSCESTCIMGGTGCVGANDHPAWESPSIEVWSPTVPRLLLRTKAPLWWTGGVGAVRW